MISLICYMRMSIALWFLNSLVEICRMKCSWEIRLDRKEGKVRGIKMRWKIRRRIRNQRRSNSLILPHSSKLWVPWKWEGWVLSIKLLSILKLTIITEISSKILEVSNHLHFFNCEHWSYLIKNIFAGNLNCLIVQIVYNINIFW